MGIIDLFKLASAPLSYGLKAIPFVSDIKNRSLVNDAIGEADAEFAKLRRAELLEKAWKSGNALPGALSKLSNERDTLDVERISSEIQQAVIRQEAKNEAQKEFVKQISTELIDAYNSGSYETTLTLIRVLQPHLVENYQVCVSLTDIYVLSLSELIISSSAADKKYEYYKLLSDYVEHYFETSDFSTLFHYGCANLYMPFANKEEKFLYLERAKKSFEKCLTFNRYIDIALNNLSVVLQYNEFDTHTKVQRLQILNDAINYLNKAKEIAPQNHKLLINLGDIYIRLAELSSEDYQQQHTFFEFAIQSYSECLKLSPSFLLIMSKANALFAIGKIEQDAKAKDNFFHEAISYYNDAYMIAQSRNDAALACLKMARVYDMAKTIECLPQEQKDELIFLGIQCHIMALEHAPFYAELQYETAKLILNIAKFGDKDIPSFKNIMQPHVQIVTQGGKKGQANGQTKQPSKQLQQVAAQTMLSVKTKLLESSYRYFRDTAYLMPKNPQAIATYGESCVYWALLQKKQGRQEKVNKELHSAAQLLDQAEKLKLHSASYVRACLHAVQDNPQECQERLKEAVQNDACPPRKLVAREPYFLGYAKERWFKDILETIPDRPVDDLYSTAIFSNLGQVGTPGGR